MTMAESENGFSSARASVAAASWVRLIPLRQSDAKAKRTTVGTPRSGVRTALRTVPICKIPGDPILALRNFLECDASSHRFSLLPLRLLQTLPDLRSEERRVGKEC